MIHVAETANKLRQLGAKIRLKGNDADKRRVLQKHCDKLGVEPVIEIGGEVAF